MAGHSPLRKRPSGPQGLEEIFVDAHAWCAEKMAPASAFSGAMPLDAFLDGDAFGQAMERVCAAHGDCDRRAAASFWSLYYGSALCIPYVVARRIGILLDIRTSALTIVIGENGLPESFGLLLPVRPVAPVGDPLLIVTPLVRDHLDPLSRLMKIRTGIAPKLCFNNAAVYLDYAFSACASGQDAPGWAAARLFEAPVLADGGRNPFEGLLRQEAEGQQIHCRRKVCCLRYQLPGIPGCGELCALPELRKS